MVKRHGIQRIHIEAKHEEKGRYMDFNIEKWTDLHLRRLQETFGPRLVFVGLQGSFGRGEATPTSDIDMVVIIDTMSFSDIESYRELVSAMPDHERACGFFAGKDELYSWPRHDVLALYYDTKPLYGDLNGLLPDLRREDMEMAISTGAANLYHAAIHTCIHAQVPQDSLGELYKSTFFLLRTKHQFDTGEYVPRKRDLLKCLEGSDKAILETALTLGGQGSLSSSAVAYRQLIEWLQKLLKDYRID